MAIDDADAPLHVTRAATARAFSRNGAARRDAALRRARRARLVGNEDEALYHEQVAAYHESHRIHEERHAALEDALAKGDTVLDFEAAEQEEIPPTPPALPRRPDS